MLNSNIRNPNYTSTVDGHVGQETWKCLYDTMNAHLETTNESGNVYYHAWGYYGSAVSTLFDFARVSGSWYCTLSYVIKSGF